MISATDAAELLASVAAVLGTAGGVLRYVAKVTAVLESAVTTGQAVAHALEQHMNDSNQLHRELTHQVADHATQLAVLNTRVDVPPRTR